MTDDPLVATLDDLWKAGAIQLPRMAVHYAQANRDTHNSRWRESEGFERQQLWAGTGSFEQRDGEKLFTALVRSMWGPGESPIAEPFGELRDLLQQAVGHTAVQLNASGEALVIIGDSYADEDTANELEILRAEREHAAPEYDLDMPPDEIPQLRGLDSPHEVRRVKTAYLEREVLER